LGRGFLLSKLAESAYNDAEIYVMEGDISATTKNFSKYSFLPEGQILKDVISDEAHKNVAEYFEKLNFDVGMLKKLERCKPLSMYFALSSFTPKSREYLTLEMGFDTLLSQKSLGKKSVEYLETLADFHGAWDNQCPSMKDASDILNHKYTDEFNETRFDDLTSIIGYTAEGDLNEVTAKYGALNEKYKSQELFHRCSVLPRNINWVEKITDIASKNKTAFLAVGAGHLIGSDNLLNLLEKKGFKIEFINQEADE
jgi:uncharacterized protein